VASSPREGISSNFNAAATLHTKDDIPPYSTTQSSDKIILVLNQNPLENWRDTGYKGIVMDRVLEGYAGFTFKDQTGFFPIIFRCFIEVKGEGTWKFIKNEE